MYLIVRIEISITFFATYQLKSPLVLVLFSQLTISLLLSPSRGTTRFKFKQNEKKTKNGTNRRGRFAFLGLKNWYKTPFAAAVVCSF